MAVRVNPGQVSVTIPDPKSVDLAIQSRFSARAFLPKPVEHALIAEMLAVAARAPSGVNTQPWKVYVLQGAALQRLVDRVCAAHDLVYREPARAKDFPRDYDYYPLQWPPVYLDRRRENGWGLYGLLGIGKADKDKMHTQHQKNYRFFGAPVGLMFTVDRALAAGSLLDYGMFLQCIMIAARARGLHTCPQAAWNEFAPLVREAIGAGESESVVCGMALGYLDPNDPVNRFDAGRVAAEDFTHWLLD